MIHSFMPPFPSRAYSAQDGTRHRKNDVYLFLSGEYSLWAGL